LWHLSVFFILSVEFAVSFIDHSGGHEIVLDRVRIVFRNAFLESIKEVKHAEVQAWWEALIDGFDHQIRWLLSKIICIISFENALLHPWMHTGSNRTHERVHVIAIR
jgi:hypothetical protein